MKYSLNPKTGLLVAGLLSVAYAEACYYPWSNTCAASGSTVDHIQFYNSDGSQTDTPVKASADWPLNYSTVGSSGVGGKQGHSGYLYCTGAAHYMDINGNNQALAVWQQGVVEGDTVTYYGAASGASCP